MTLWHSVAVGSPQFGASGPRGHLLAAGCVTVTLQVTVRCVITVGINEHEMCVAEVHLRPTSHVAAHWRLQHNP